MADEESLAWDRVGRFLQQSGSKASQMADRNLKLWPSVSSHLKKDGKYTADDMADDVAKSMTTAMNNMSDIWTMLTREPRQSQVAHPLPTAFLLFRWTGPLRYQLHEPVRIDVDFDLKGKVLPPRAKIALTGTRTPASQAEQDEAQPAGKVATSTDGVTRLQNCVVARRASGSPAYVVETVNYHIVGGAVDAEPGLFDGLVPGVYDGIVYLTDPTMALASIRILVEDQDPQPVDGDE